MHVCLHDPEEYGDPCELCEVKDHPARKAMAEALFEEMYGDSTEFAGERMDMSDEIVDHMLTAAAQAGWTLHSSNEEADSEQELA